MDSHVSEAGPPAPVAARTAARGRSATLSRPIAAVVEQAVIPHLLLRCREQVPERRPTRLHVETLVRLALSRDGAAAAAQLADLRRAGYALDGLLHDLVVPAARRLGEMWHADAVDFVEVAVATTRLTAAVRELCLAQASRYLPTADAPSVLIASSAEERHSLGALIAAHDFRAAGWHVIERPGADAACLADALAASTVDLLGLSTACVERLEGLAALVRLVRRRSRNPDLLVTISGAAALRAPAAALDAGADFVAQDGREAVAVAERHLSQRRGAATLGAAITE